MFIIKHLNLNFSLLSFLHSFGIFHFLSFLTQICSQELDECIYFSTSNISHTFLFPMASSSTRDLDRLPNAPTFGMNTHHPMPIFHFSINKTNFQLEPCLSTLISLLSNNLWEEVVLSIYHQIKFWIVLLFNLMSMKWCDWTVDILFGFSVSGISFSFSCMSYVVLAICAETEPISSHWFRCKFYEWATLSWAFSYKCWLLFLALNNTRISLWLSFSQCFELSIIPAFTLIVFYTMSTTI